MAIFLIQANVSLNALVKNSRNILQAQHYTQSAAYSTHYIQFGAKTRHVQALFKRLIAQHWIIYDRVTI